MILRFRFWDKDEKYFITEATIVLDKDGSVEGIEYYHTKLGHSVYNDISYYELLQSTGLKDKNGVEIFEGDIVKDINGEIGYIAFLKQEMGYVIVYKNRDRRLGHRNGIEVHDLNVISNIYENEDLRI